jgi:hypothetical protein
LTCSTEKLSALLDGDLSAREASKVRAHAEGCAASRRALAELDALRGALAAQALDPPQPERDGWAELAAQLSKTGPTGPAPQRRWRWLWAPTVGLAGALALLVVRQRLAPRGPSDDQLIAQAEGEFRRADTQYQHAIEKLRQVADRSFARRAQAAPQAAGFRDAEARLEAAVEECRRVARARPSDVDAEQLLFAAYRRQIDFYEGQLLTASAASPSRGGR